MKLLALVVITLTSSLFQLEAFACGDSLYRAGRGVAYRVHSAPLPGNLLVFAATKQQQDVASQLESSGHDVDVVSSREELAAAMVSGNYDVVIAPLGQSATVTDVSTTSVFLPIADRSQQRQARKLFGQSVSSGANVKAYLKAIHRMLSDQVT